jgi:hypothetical protein
VESLIGAGFEKHHPLLANSCAALESSSRNINQEYKYSIAIIRWNAQ